MSAFHPRTMLVTGGAGFIGCRFVRHTLGAMPDLKIVTLDALTYAGSLDNLADLPNAANHTFVKGDIRDRALVDSLLRQYKIDTIAHFAAESHVDRSIVGPDAFIQTNLIGTFTLLEAARQFWLKEQSWDKDSCRFHHVSTDEVYGMLGPKDPAFSETTPYAPNSPYSASKAGSDHLVRAYHHTYGLPTTTSNCSNNYGPCQHPEKFIPTVIRACKSKTPIPVYGDGSNVRDWLYVDDHCEALLAIILRGRLGETYNVGGDNERSNIDLAKMLCRVFGQQTGHPVKNLLELITMVPDRPGHDWRYAIDARKIKTELAWSARESFESGLTKTVQWYLSR